MLEPDNKGDSMIGKKSTMELRRWTKTSDGMGGYTEAWAGLRKIKGTLSTIRGDERLSADKLTVIADSYWYIDYPVGISITEKDIFVKNTITYKIIYIQNIGNNRNNILKITLKKEE